MIIYKQQPSRQAIAKSVETLTVINRAMGVIQLNPFPAPLPLKQSCSPLHLPFKLKSINIEKGGEGREGRWDFFFKVEDEFQEEEANFRCNVSTFLQLLIAAPVHADVQCYIDHLLVKRIWICK